MEFFGMGFHRDFLLLYFRTSVKIAVGIKCSRAYGWVRNVVLIKCIFGSGKPKGGSGSWVGGYMGQVRERGVSLQAT